MTLLEVLRGRAASLPDALAVVMLEDGEKESGHLTFGGLDRAARALAARLQAEGSAGDRALLLYPSSLDFVVAYCACLYSGVVPVPCYPPGRLRPDRRLPVIAGDAEARWALTSNRVLEARATQVAHYPELGALSWIATDAIEAGDGASAEDWREPAIGGEALALLQYTSGSTSAPRGVMVTHRHILDNVRDMDANWGHPPGSVMVTWLPLFHDMGLIYGLLQPLLMGFPCVMMPPATFLQRPLRWLAAISDYRGTHSAAPNFAYDLCARKITEEEKNGLDLSSWRVALNAAETVRAETLAGFHAAFAPCGLGANVLTPGFGLAESTLKVTTNPAARLATILRIDEVELSKNRVRVVGADISGATAIVGCGVPVDETLVRIVAPDSRRRLEEDQVGEIWVGGRIVAGGYWKRTGETEEVFGGRIAETGEGPFLRTGDLGFLHDGELFVTGRIKDLIIVNGLNHYPQDLELTSETAHPACRASGAASFAIEVAGEERVVVIQEIERSMLRKIEPDAVMAAIRTRLVEEHGVPVHAVALLKPNALPKTSSGKVMRGACRAAFLEGAIETIGAWREADCVEIGRSRRGGSETRPYGMIVIDMLSRRFGVPVEAIDHQASFASYGLDSAGAVALSGELASALGRDLPPTIFYDYPTVAALVGYLQEGDTRRGKASLAPTESTVGGSPWGTARRAPTGNDRGGGIQDARSALAREPIAVVGMACRFPGAENVEAYWRLLSEGGDAIREVPVDRWDANALFDADQDAPGKMTTKWGGFLDGIDRFDADFFGLSPREAESMDPQQRLLMELTWAALEDAALPADRLAGTATGVFVGVSNFDYARLLLRENGGTDIYAGTGTALSITANRLSYWLDLRGPSVAIDTACSSSLVAIHQAIRALRGGECDLALTGGVNVILAPDYTISFSKAGLMAPDGRCKAFDAAADGYVRSEGCGLVVLKRLADARRDGDRVLAVIHGSAVNQDGRSNGLTAPNGPAQVEVIRRALRDGDVAPGAIGYVEAHGTGTALGDPIEVGAIREALGEGRGDAPCVIGSVKANIGHLESAAGIAGLIKVILMLRHAEIPGQLHYKTINPRLGIEETRFTIAASRRPWDGARLAGVSSFGFGGTNAHVIVGQVDGDDPGESSRGTARRAPAETTFGSPTTDLLVFSAKSDASLRKMAARYAELLRERPEIRLEDLCYSAITCRTHLPRRLALVADSIGEMRERLESIDRDWGGEGGRPSDKFLNINNAGNGTPVFGPALEMHASAGPLRRSEDRRSEDHGFLVDRLFQRPAEVAVDRAPTGNDQGISPWVNDIIIGARDVVAPVAPAFLFTGHGSIYPGMGAELYATEPVFRDAIDRCDAILRPILDASLCDAFFRETDRLKRMDWSQPALFALQYALTGLWASWGVRPSAVAGHSAGEYAAAWAAGVFSLEDGLRLIAERGRLMRTLPPDGAMAAVMADESVVREAIGDRDDLAVAVANSPVNTILSGRRESLEAVTAALAARGIKCTPLDIPVAAHSPLVEPILAAFESFARDIRFSPPRIPLLSNVSGGIAGDEVTRPGYWVRHFRETVRFGENLRTLEDAGYRTLLEIGPHPTLIGIAEENLPCEGRSWAASLDRDRSPVRQIRVALGALHSAGVPIDWASARRDRGGVRIALPRYPFQRRRYWFQIEANSVGAGLRPAPTGFTNSDVDRVGAGSGSAPAGFADVANDLVVEWRPVSAPAMIARKDRLALVVARVSRVRDELVTTLLGYGWKARAIDWPLSADRAAWAELLADGERPIDRVIALPADSSDAMELFLAFASLAEALKETPGARLLAVTRGACRVLDEDRPAGGAPGVLWGLRKNLRLEAPDLETRILDLDAASSTDEAPVILRELESGDDEAETAWRGGRRFVPRLVRCRMAPSRPIEWREDGTYLITGGLGGLGLAMARRMVERGARTLVLVSRGGASTEERRRAVAELEARGARVVPATVDIGSSTAVAALEAILATLPPLLGVIHGAGLGEKKLLALLEREDLEPLLAAKVRGAENLDRLVAERPLEFFVCLSSMVAAWGAVEQAHYVAANHMLDLFATRRSAEGRRTVAIALGPVKGGGMLHAGFERLEGMGLGAWTLEEAVAIIERLAAASVAHVIAARIDWDRYRAVFEARRRLPLFTELGPVDAAPPTAPAPSVVDWSGEEGARRLLHLLRAELIAVLRLRPSAPPADAAGFFSLGMDSITAMQFRRRLEKRLGIGLAATVVFSHSTLETLSAHLLDRFRGDVSATASKESAIVAETPSTDSDAIEARLRRLDRLVKRS